VDGVRKVVKLSAVNCAVEQMIYTLLVKLICVIG
jgi:hypothetical protein